MNQSDPCSMMPVEDRMGMLSAIGMESFYIGDTVYTDDVLSSMSLEDLEELKIRLNSEIIAILTSLKTEQIKSDMVIDPMSEPKTAEWYITTNQVLAKYQRFLPYLANIIRRRKISSRTTESYFMDVAREQLDADDFKFILSEAKSRRDAAKGNEV